jgi:pimeloyl-ACP methyl ester carboxylesterase
MTNDNGCEPSGCGQACGPPATLADALRRFDNEATHGVCDTGRYRCAYHVWGAGPSLVFVHGLTDSARSFVLPMARLAARFRCVAYDLPTGRGDGARLGRLTHKFLVEDLLTLLDHLGLRQSYLYGSSFGSTVALAALHREPRRFPRAVLQGGFARRPLAPAELLLARLARYWPWPLRALPLREELLIGADRGPFQSCAPEVWRFYLANSGALPMKAVAYRALMLNGVDLRSILPAIRQPVLMVCGDCDPAVNRACEDVLLGGLPNVRRVEVESCGHFPYFTHPDVLAELVRQFLTPPAADGASACPAAAPAAAG